MYIKPCFYDSFKCKADKCTDTCCAGWEVDIDEVSLSKYGSVYGDFGARIIASITDNDGCKCFRLDENDRCVFLNKCGLCDIYSSLGEDYLCDICREHPRFYDEFDGILQCGLGLCCEKVCEMLLDTEVLTFEKDFLYDDIEDDVKLLLEARDYSFNIISDDKISFEQRMKNLISFAEQSECDLFGESSYGYSFKNKRDSVFDIVELYSKTEPINSFWTEFISSLKDSLPIIYNCKYEPDIFLYEKILKYIIYRHFMNCRFDGRICDVIRFALGAIVFIYVCECYVFTEKGVVCDTDKINIIKRWSQQIEYSQENTDMCLTFTG